MLTGTVFFPAFEMSKDPHVLFVGRIQEAKGARDLLLAWVRVLGHCPTARLTLIGERPNRWFVFATGTIAWSQ